MMRKILIYCSFIIASLFVVVAFMTATTYIQLAVAIFLYPLLILFAFKAFLPKTLRYSKKPVTEVPPPVVTSTEKRENVGISDIDKRAFLKLIGGAGLTLFFFSIFNKKAEGLFFKSLPGPGRVSLEDTLGNKIDPTQAQPTDGYRISEIDDNDITFYGFTNKDGAWFIMRGDTDTGSFRYSRGNSNFPGNWSNRENLKYDYFSNVFKP